MGVLDFLKGTKKEPSLKGDLDIPAAPPSAEELPELPAPGELRKQGFKISAEKPAKGEEVYRPLTRDIESFERKAVKEEAEELEFRGELELKQPIFMHLNTFKEVMEENQMIIQILKENEDTLVRVMQFKEDEDFEFKRWDNALLDIQKKLIFADKTLFGTSE